MIFGRCRPIGVPAFSCARTMCYTVTFVYVPRREGWEAFETQGKCRPLSVSHRRSPNPTTLRADQRCCVGRIRGHGAEGCYMRDDEGDGGLSRVECSAGDFVFGARKQTGHIYSLLPPSPLDPPPPYKQ
eukprot:6210562-Pleurochrysis_carterae.AAC.2